MRAFKVRNATGEVISQHIRKTAPPKPVDYDGKWDVEETDKSDLNSEPVNWWDE